MLNIPGLQFDLGEDVAMLRDSLQQFTAAEITLSKLRNDRVAAQKQLRDSRKRILSTIKGIYGDDSNEYEMVGGTRMSERKRTKSSPTDQSQPAVASWI